MKATRTAMFKKISLTISIFIIFLISGCGSQQTYQKTGFYLYNIFDITLVAGKKMSSSTADKVLNRGLESIRDLDSHLNMLNPISDINAVNDNAAKRPVKVSSEVFALFEKSMTGAELTEGAFDITIEPLLKLYKGKSQPSATQVKNSLRKVDYSKVLLDLSYQTVRFSEPYLKVSFDLMKKGYAIDLITKNLEKNRVQSALIRSSNTLYALGKKKAWPIAIPHPEDPKKKLAKFSIKDKGYSKITPEQNNFYKEASSWLFYVRESKKIDDKSLPIYVGVLAPNAVTAEVLAHAVFVLGQERGLALIKKLNYEGVYMTRTEENGLQIFATNGLKNKFKGVTVN